MSISSLSSLSDEEDDYFGYEDDEERQPNRTRFEKLKSLRNKVNWLKKRKRLRLVAKLDRLVEDWYDEPNLQGSFTSEQIECLLLDCATIKDASVQTGRAFINFLVRSGCKDKPELEEAGKPIACRTTALHHVIRGKPRDWKDVVRHLFEFYDRYDVNYVDEGGLTHFHGACKFGLVEVVEKFLEAGQDPNCEWPETGDTPLHLALLSENGRKTAELLMKNGADTTAANLQGVTPLHMISKREDDDEQLVETLLTRSEHMNQRVRFDARDNLGNTALHVALLHDNRDVAELLLIRGADSNLTNNEGSTPLHIICQKEFDEGLATSFFSVNDVLQRTVAINARDKAGWTPLEWAVANLFPDVVQLLLDRGADLTDFVFPSEDYFGVTLKPSLDYQWRDSFKLIVVSCSLAVVERLEARGYELTRNGALTIMKLFRKNRVYEKPANFVKSWHKKLGFARAAKCIKALQPSLTLYKLTEMPLAEAADLMTYEDWFRFVCAKELHHLPPGPKEACIVHLCRIIARGFFRSWMLEFFMELSRRRLPFEISEMILNHLGDEDSINICFALIED